MRFIAAILYFIAITCVTAVTFSLVSGGLKPLVALLSLACGAGVSCWALWQERGISESRKPLGVWDWLAISAWSMFTLRCFLWLVFRDGDEMKVLSANNLGDMSIHVTFIRYLASGVPFWPDNPICTGAPLTYPVGTDLFNAVLLSVGVNLMVGLTWVGLIGAACIGGSLWRWGGAFALAGILFNGGTVVFEEWMKPGAKWEFRDYLTDRAWNSIPLALIVTQRGLLFALPASLLLLDKWRTRFLGAPAKAGWQFPPWGELVLYATMPLFHLHAFMFLSLALGWWILAVPAARKEAFLLGIRAFVPATLLTLLVTGSFFGHDTVAKDYGWTWEAPDAEHPERPGFLLYIFKNFGLLPVLLVWLVVELVRKRAIAEARTSLHIAIPALTMLIACFVLRFAPWDWDNSKLIMLAYVALLPLLWQHVLSRWPMPVRAAICFFMFFSGFISLFGAMGGKNHGYGIGSIRLQNEIMSAIRDIQPTERFGIFPNWNHPILLVGRKAAQGFRGHIYSHGLGDSERDKKVDSLMNGEPNWRENARALGVRYIFWGAMERENFPNSKQPWTTEADKIAKGDWGELYDISIAR